MAQVMVLIQEVVVSGEISISDWPQRATNIGYYMGKYVREGQFYFHHAYDANNFLWILTPQPDDMEKFFGPRSFNVFVAQKPYGWNRSTFTWPPVGWEDARLRYLNSIERWKYYLTIIYCDLEPPQSVAATCAGEDPPSFSDYRAKMLDTGAKIRDFCISTPGFLFGGFDPREENIRPLFEQFFRYGYVDFEPPNTDPGAAT